jgi:hypothetical protein
MKTLLRLSALTLGLALASTVSYADTVSMTFNSVGGAVSDGGAYYVYPYNFTVDDVSDIALMCVSFDDEIQTGESWPATTSAITTASVALAQEDAYLFSLIGSVGSSGAPTIQDIQEAAWDLSVTGTQPFGGSSAAAALAVEAFDVIKTGGTDLSSFDDGQYTLYTPTGNDVTGEPSGDTMPQTFVGVSPVPEPSSLLLLASGLLGFAVFYRRRHLTI